MAQPVTIEKLDVSAYTVPTSSAEADGTFSWDETTIVIVESHAGRWTGVGYTYADLSTAHLIRETLADVVQNADAMAVREVWTATVGKVRNLGQRGIAMMAISAVDSSLWDLKARILDLPLASLIGQLRRGVPVYGSGGFTTYSREQLQSQFGDWVRRGIPRVKMKVGANPGDDVERVRQARQAIGPETELFVDANGAYSQTQAVKLAEKFAEEGVVWFEEPVPSDDLTGLNFVRNHAPAGMDVTAGEYGYELSYFRRMLAAGAVDVMQADATRCGGITGFLGVATLCQAFHIPFSAHCAPALHAHPACCAPNLRHVEYFHDHVRIEDMLFDGVIKPENGTLTPDPSQPGNGLDLKRSDAERYRKF